jgi:LuxR family maltose regulon positive regulatory protein
MLRTATQHARTHLETVMTPTPLTQHLGGTRQASVPGQRTLEVLSASAVSGRAPILPRTYVPRTRLGIALDSTTRDGGVTVLVAPAGAGKTLGAAGWLRDRGLQERAVWVPRADTVTPSDLEALTVARDIGSEGHLLVVDDAHELSTESTAWLDEMLDRAPDRLGVLLLSRWDLPLTRLVHELRGSLSVLRGGLLRLDDEETTQLVADHARNDSPDLAREISARTRGWCAAVVLAAKAVGERPDPLAAARNLATNVGILDRVASEAFAALTPQQRHLLLCVAAEPVVQDSSAARLTGDAVAGRVLEQLESTGLHVTRYDDARAWIRPRPMDAGPSPSGDLPLDEPAYVVHPLMRELARRRLASGGADVERARATVRHAVEQDLGRGELADAVRRLVTVGDHETVLRTLASHGPAIVLLGHTRDVASFAQAHPDLVEEAQDCWFTFALERWESGDVARARDWLDRMSRDTRPASRRRIAPEAVSPLDAVCARALRGYLGDEPLERVRDEGEAALTVHGDDADWSRVSLLRLLVGTAHVRLGDVHAAEGHLTAVADPDGRAARSTALTVRATSQLALAQILQGREHTAARLTVPGRLQQGHARTAGLDIARQVAALQALSAARGDTAPLTATEHQTTDDPVAHVLLQVLRSRRLLLQGRAAEAQRVLQTGVATTCTPAPLRGTVLVEQALQAALTGDRDSLRAVAAELTELGLPGEAALAEGFRADLSDDLAKAADLFATSAGNATLRQPPVAAVALVARAQVLDALGRPGEATHDLLEAVRTSEVRRTFVPFLGWIRHGRPVPDLLHELAGQQRTPWSAELAEATTRRTALVSTAGVMTATPQEQAHVSNGATYVSLSPRERDVLHELARGSTYADIAANLFLSENTVKTHVSSVYAKLAVNRRSDALAVARTLHLL